MEHENLPLEDLVSHYEKGSALLKLITLRNDSTESPAKTGTQAGAPSQSESPDATDEDDIRLF